MSDWLGMYGPPRMPRAELRERVLTRALHERRTTRWPMAVAAVLTLAVAAVLARQSVLSTRMTALSDSLSAMRSAGARAMYVPVNVAGRQGAITLVADHERNRLLVSCYNLEPNASGQAYQIWFVTASGYISASLMPMDSPEPMAMVLDLPRDVAGVTGAAMSIEPRAGSRTVTGPVIFEQRL